MDPFNIIWQQTILFISNSTQGCWEKALKFLGPK